MFIFYQTFFTGIFQVVCEFSAVFLFFCVVWVRIHAALAVMRDNPAIFALVAKLLILRNTHRCQKFCGLVVLAVLHGIWTHGIRASSGIGRLPIPWHANFIIKCCARTDVRTAIPWVAPAQLFIELEPRITQSAFVRIVRICGYTILEIVCPAQHCALLRTQYWLVPHGETGTDLRVIRFTG